MQQMNANKGIMGQLGCGWHKCGLKAGCKLLLQDVWWHHQTAEHHRLLNNEHNAGLYERSAGVLSACTAQTAAWRPPNHLHPKSLWRAKNSSMHVQWHTTPRHARHQQLLRSYHQPLTWCLEGMDHRAGNLYGSAKGCSVLS